MVEEITHRQTIFFISNWIFLKFHQGQNVICWPKFDPGKFWDYKNNYEIRFLYNFMSSMDLTMTFLVGVTVHYYKGRKEWIV